MQAVCHAFGAADETCGARVFADADEDAFARRPWSLDGARLHLGEELLIDALGGAPQRELAQRREVGGREEVLERPFRLLRDIDLAFLQPLDQVVGCQIDELDGIGAVEDGVGHGLADPHAGDLCNDVVQAFDMLDIDRRINIDSPPQQFFDVEIALGMAASRCIGMSKLVDESDLRPAGQDRIDVHFMK